MKMENNKKNGYGPWFVVLLFNENENYPTRLRGSKRKTDIVLHTYAHRIASIRNVQNENDNWVMMQLVGPFSKEAEALKYKILWSKKVRNKKAKLQRGIYLLNEYGMKYKIKMWHQTQTKDEIEQQKQVLKSGYKQSATKRYLEIPEGEKIDIQTIQEMQKKRKI